MKAKKERRRARKTSQEWFLLIFRVTLMSIKLKTKKIGIVYESEAKNVTRTGFFVVSFRVLRSVMCFCVNLIYQFNTV